MGRWLEETSQAKEFFSGILKFSGPAFLISKKDVEGDHRLFPSIFKNMYLSFFSFEMGSQLCSSGAHCVDTMNSEIHLPMSQAY